MVAVSAKHRVLVVDDDPDCRLMLSSLVTKAGYDVDSVADAGMAMSILATRPPDVVLLDAHLPGVDGWQVCESIKRDRATRTTPVVMLTAFSSPAAKERSRTAGADHYVEKPFRADHLLGLIAGLLHT